MIWVDGEGEAGGGADSTEIAEWKKKKLSEIEIEQVFGVKFSAWNVIKWVWVLRWWLRCFEGDPYIQICVAAVKPLKAAK